MITLILTLITSVIGKVLDGIIEDKVQKAAIMAALIPAIMQEAAAQNLLIQKDQTVVNPETNKLGWALINGWRIFAEWSVVLAWDYAVIISPVFNLPPIPSSELSTILMALLGLGALRVIQSVGGK